MQTWYLLWITSAKDCFHCTPTTHCLLSVLLYIQHLLPHYHCYYSEAVVRKCSTKKGVLRNFTKFSGKYLCQSLFFDKIAGLRPATLSKKRLWHRYFSVNFANFLRAPFVTDHFWWLLLTTVSISDVCFWFTFKRLPKYLNLVPHFQWSCCS